MVDFVVEELVVGVYAAADGGADEDTQEGQRGGYSGPAAEFSEDDGDPAELHVQDAVAEAGVQRDEEADWGGEELDRADEEFPRELDDADVPFFEFRVQRPVVAFVAEAAGFVDEEFGRVAFVDEEEVDEQDGAL